MNHDKTYQTDKFGDLLATLKSENFRKSRTAETPYFALRAVVELHFINPDPVSISAVECWACDTEYPCPTIQAIERELSV